MNRAFQVELIHRRTPWKTKYFHLANFGDIEQLNAGLKRYIDDYNRHRIKSKLGGMSPWNIDYRQHAAKA